MIAPNFSQNRGDLLVLRDAAERVAVEVQRAGHVLVGQLHPRRLEPEGDLRGHGVHRRCPSGQPCQRMQGRCGVHLEEG